MDTLCSSAFGFASAFGFPLCLVTFKHPQHAAAHLDTPLDLLAFKPTHNEPTGLRALFKLTLEAADILDQIF
jgi:hypothetical protein